MAKLDRGHSSRTLSGPLTLGVHLSYIAPFLCVVSCLYQILDIDSPMHASVRTFECARNSIVRPYDEPAMNCACARKSFMRSLCGMFARVCYVYHLYLVRSCVRFSCVHVTALPVLCVVKYICCRVYHPRCEACARSPTLYGFGAKYRDEELTLLSSLFPFDRFSNAGTCVCYI